jgi:hypothetical protein
MSSGAKQAVKKILSSANPEQMAYGMVNAYVSRNPQYAPLWKQAQEMAGSGNAKEKAVNMFSERGVDVEEIINGVAKEIQQ